MANTFKGGSAVQSGYYLNLSRWSIEPVAKDGERLPQGKGEWRRVPVALALVLTPVLGATFLMFMPVIGFVLLAQAIAMRAVRTFRGPAEELAATMSPGWQPGEAHFTGKSTENGGVEEKGPTARDEKLEALEKEIEAKRRQS
ncbi:hypothetical protein [Anaeromyxobacter sp. PSR-1]|uniref:hypothetical protein n=1 Tax=unclassified Anaeromyxobacter TaxID=2620896 RepID=UPI0005DE8D96|nr:hypothetical protein [Anaeromyxobacter sp. PSR-1]GAO03736.1 hypothetical protein PSR1_02621 [Anaeromyxobacter sp. PSR-1]